MNYSPPRIQKNNQLKLHLNMLRARFANVIHTIKTSERITDSNVRFLSEYKKMKKKTEKELSKFERGSPPGKPCKMRKKK